MVFKMATLDLTRGLEEDFPPESPLTPPSSSAHLCFSVSFALASSLTIELACRRHPRVPAAVAQCEEEIQLQRGTLAKFTLKELKVATRKFKRENILGTGGFGTVYRGQLDNGYPAAIKRCRKFRHATMAEFQVEVTIGNMPNHLNVLPLLGFCEAPKSKEYLLVYPLMVNGSVASWLGGRTESQPPLSWPLRMKIALGAARGLRHLHSLKIIHRDIKAANIMLDESFEPLIGDFGLARIAADWKQVQNDEHVAESDTRAAADLASQNSRTIAESAHEDPTVETAVRGTIGYIAPEYLSAGQCSLKCDIFSFGVTLLELLTGQRVFDLTRLDNGDDALLIDWVSRVLRMNNRLEDMMDPNMQGDYDDGEAEKLTKTALLCTQSNPRERPNAWELVQFIEGNGWCERMENQKDLAFMLAREQCWCPGYCPLTDSASPLRAEELSGPR